MQMQISPDITKCCIPERELGKISTLVNPGIGGIYLENLIGGIVRSKKKSSDQNPASGIQGVRLKRACDKWLLCRLLEELFRVCSARCKLRI